MKTSTLIWLAVIIIVLGGWYWWSHQGSGSQLANPASVNCTQTLGGTLEIVDEANGQVGYCHLPDGRVCEEWALYQGGTCTPPAATSTPSTTTSATSSPGILYASGTPLLGHAATTSVGSYLTAFNGMTLYTFANDTTGVSNCSGICAAIWPPYLVTNRSPLTDVQPGVSGKVSVITRTDGTMQVTYNGMPLYFYKSDTAPGDTSGQGVKGVWSVAKP
ncbi:MAG TPA: DUF333 domain-containing protein [Candidatus Paceibacterota bacterium]|nr:DUF333 domain-containing protein [Candidatus Paceibacterota bacterium]